MAQQIEQFKLRPFANMLDAGGATAASYDIPKNAPWWLVIIDGEGKIAFNASRAWSWTTGSDGRSIQQVQFEASLKTSPGILGTQEVPASMEAAAHYFDLQQFDLLEQELRKAEARSVEADKKFSESMRAKVAGLRSTRLDQIRKLSETDPIQGFRDAQSFVSAFPQTPEKAPATDLLKKMQVLPEVKKEIAAEEAFQRMLVPELKTALTYKAFMARIPALHQAYQKNHGTTRYGQAVTDVIDTHRKSVP